MRNIQSYEYQISNRGETILQRSCAHLNKNNDNLFNQRYIVKVSYFLFFFYKEIFYWYFKRWNIVDLKIHWARQERCKWFSLSLSHKKIKNHRKNNSRSNSSCCCCYCCWFFLTSSISLISRIVPLNLFFWPNFWRKNFRPTKTQIEIPYNWEMILFAKAKYSRTYRSWLMAPLALIALGTFKIF